MDTENGFDERFSVNSVPLAIVRRHPLGISMGVSVPL